MVFPKISVSLALQNYGARVHGIVEMCYEKHHTKMFEINKRRRPYQGKGTSS